MQRRLQYFVTLLDMHLMPVDTCSFGVYDAALLRGRLFPSRMVHWIIYSEFSNCGDSVVIVSYQDCLPQVTGSLLHRLFVV
jgi:hypothetical protein